MTHAAAAHFTDGLDLFRSVMTQLQPDDWDLASPCEGWTTRDVLGHLGTSVDMGAAFLRGEQPTPPQADRPADLVEGDPVAWWDARTADVRAALAAADMDQVVDTPMGPRSVGDRVAFPAIDLYVHAWDVGHPAGVQVVIPGALMDFAHQHIDPFPEEVVRGEGRAFGPKVDLPEDASEVEAFLAWTGRDPR